MQPESIPSATNVDAEMIEHVIPPSIHFDCEADALFFDDSDLAFTCMTLIESRLTVARNTNFIGIETNNKEVCF